MSGAVADQSPAEPGPGPGPGVGSGLTVAVDAMGGDHAPEQIVAGAVAASREAGIQIILAGLPGPLNAELATHGITADEIPIAPAEDVLGMSEGALAIRRRPRSSIAVACQLGRRGPAAAVVSAGPTGGIVTTARLRLRPLDGGGGAGPGAGLPAPPRGAAPRA